MEIEIHKKRELKAFIRDLKQSVSIPDRLEEILYFLHDNGCSFLYERKSSEVYYIGFANRRIVGAISNKLNDPYSDQWTIYFDVILKDCYGKQAMGVLPFPCSLEQSLFVKDSLSRLTHLSLSEVRKLDNATTIRQYP